MAVQIAPLVIGVRFHKVGKLYHFDASAFPEVRPADFVIVETSRGRQLGQVIGIIDPAQADLDSLKSIKAPATPRDLMMKKTKVKSPTFRHSVLRYPLQSEPEILPALVQLSQWAVPVQSSGCGSPHCSVWDLNMLKLCCHLISERFMKTIVSAQDLCIT